MVAPTKTDRIVEAYCDGVLDGEIVTGKLVRLAVKRHLRDLERGADRGLHYDSAAAERAVGFFQFLRHSKGRGFAGEPFVLSPWQVFIVASIFGWKRADGTRRFRTAYIEIARKNGKSTFAAALGLYLLVADGEPGAEIYTAATKLKQARIIHEEAKRMVAKSPDLKQLVETWKDNLNCPATNSKYEPLGADGDTEDGLNPHAALVDEVHAHKTRAILDVLDTAFGSRDQPLMIMITTAGNDTTSICYEKHEYGRGVLGAVDPDAAAFDDAWFVFIAGLDEGDDWRDESVWGKANPNLGVSVKIDFLREQVQKAKESPRYQNTVRQKLLNQWVEQAVRWLDMDTWDRCRGVIVRRELHKAVCCGGLDAATKLDLTALCWVFKIEEIYKLLWRFWIPEDTAAEREEKDRVPYRHWAERGFVELTPGNVTDYRYIEQRIQEDAERYLVKQVAFDPWNLTQTATNLDGYGIPMVEFGQTIRNFNEPSQEFERLLIAGEIQHGNHPVATWNAGNVAVRTDPSGNIRPVKPEHKDPKKIDGIVAAIMGLAGWLDGDDGQSVYDRRDPLELEF